MRYAFSAAILAFAPAALPAQSEVSGRVTGEGRAVPGARVSIQPGGAATRTDRNGGFRIPVQPGQARLRIAAIGFRGLDTTVSVPTASPLILSLEPTVARLDPLVVTGTLREQAVSESPVKVQVVSSSFLDRGITSNLMEAISSIHGLNQQVDCAVCYTNSVRINGMEGPYTAVLIDGVPMMGALAAVYGLNGINPALIEQIEIVKGPASTLYGSEAMGGVVNVITKDPRFTPTVMLDVSRADHGQTAVDLGLSPRRGDLSLLVSAHYSGNSKFVDDNGDGFSDVPLDRRASLFARTDLDRDGHQIFGLAARVYWEDRFGGVRGWRRDRDRGSSTLYGESIITRRAELAGGFQPLVRGRNLRVQMAAALHRQESWYGDTPYEGRQDLLFGQVLWDHRLGASSTLLTGASLRYDVYDDGTPATPVPDRRFVPGLFAEYGVTPAPGLSLLLGGRLDRHQAHGLIPAPRAALKWDVNEETAVRVNTGTGFRVVNLFTEDHAALTGSREVVIAEALLPERSWSVSGNLNRVIAFGRNPMMVDVDLFYTRFTNRIVPDYDQDPGLIVYRNLDGVSVSRGAAIAFNQNFAETPLQYHAGLTWQDVTVTREGVRERQLFSPRLRAVFGAGWTLPVAGIALDWQGSLTGPMRLPAYPPPHERATRSPTYAVHNLQLQLPVAARARVWLSARNLFDYRQPSPLVAPDDPFGPDFDTTWVYGPVEGRRLVLGFRWGAAP